jgi:host factor-I protein
VALNQEIETDVTVFLVNGIKLQGQIRQFDTFTALLVRESGAQVAYKYTISIISPAEPVQLTVPTDER